jgi:hypothetical protein
MAASHSIPCLRVWLVRSARVAFVSTKSLVSRKVLQTSSLHHHSSLPFLDTTSAPCLFRNTAFDSTHHQVRRARLHEVRSRRIFFNPPAPKDDNHINVFFSQLIRP